jgi:hypothetical protein
VIAIRDYIYVSSDRGLADALLQYFPVRNYIDLQLFTPIHRATENRSVGGSIPPLGTTPYLPFGLRN